MNLVYSSGDITKIRTRYRARDTIYFDPCEVVFQAQVSAIPSATEGTYLQISYDTVSVGAYTDIKTGQRVIISETDDHTAPLSDYRDMRVSKTPTASILYINESALPLELDYYITVIDTYVPLPMVRKGSLVDGHLSYQNLAPTIKGLKSVYFAESSITAQFSFPDVVGVSHTGGSITYLWDMDVTYDTGTNTSQNPVVTAPHGHQWGRLTVTDSNGPTQWMAFQLIVQDPENPTLATQNIDRLRLNRTWQGHHLTCTAYSGVGVSSVMNGTRAVLISKRTYAGGALDGGMENVAFVGYLSKEANSTQSVSDKSTQFDLVGIWERAGQLPFNPIAIRDVATPDSWDEIDLPTTQKVVAHILSRYSTILNLCSLNLDVTDNTWYGGDMDLSATSLGDAIEQVVSEINAAIIQNPSGELFLRRDLRFLPDDDRDDADVVWTLTNRDLINLDVNIRHDEQTGRIVVGFRGFFTNRSPSKGGKAVAPVVTLGTSPQTQTRPNQLLQANQSDTALKAEAELRAGDLLAAENPPFEMTAGIMPYLSWLNTSCHQWIVLDLAASLITRGRAFDNRTLLESLELSYDNIAGSHDLTVSLLPETRSGGALVVAALTPNVSSLSMFVLPPMSAYGGNYGGPSTLNGDNARFNRKNMGGMGVPIPPDQSYEESQYAPEAGKKKFAISFANSSNVGAGFTSVNTEPYLVTVSGFAALGDVNGLVETYDFTTSDHGFVPLPTTNPYAIYHAGEGWGRGTEDIGRIGIQKDLTADSYIRAVFTYNESLTNGFATVATYPYPPLVGIATDTSNTDTVDVSYAAAPGFACDTGQIGVVLTTTLRLTTLVLTRQGTTGRYADAFYSWELNEDGEEIDISLLGASAGFFINNATATGTPPPYSPDHTYTFEWTGDGNIPQVRFEDPNGDWSDNENLPLYVTFEGPGADD